MEGVEGRRGVGWWAWETGVGSEDLDWAVGRSVVASAEDSCCVCPLVYFFDCSGTTCRLAGFSQ